LTTHIDEWFEQPKNKDIINFLYRTKSTVIRQGGHSKDEPKTKWAYCLHCKKGSFLGIKCHKPAEFICEHKRTDCSNHFSEYAARFEPYITMNTEEQKPVLEIVEDKPNTEMMEMKALIEKLQAENQALKATVNEKKQQKPVEDDEDDEDDEDEEEDQTLKEEVETLRLVEKNLYKQIEKLRQTNRETESLIDNWVIRLDIEDKHQFDRVHNEMMNWLERH